jgi:hypothetical protein
MFGGMTVTTKVLASHDPSPSGTGQLDRDNVLPFLRQERRTAAVSDARTDGARAG